MNRIAPILPLLLLLQACSEPAFYFRGYNSDSTCSAIIDTELALGAGFVDAYESRDPERPGYITELTGELFDEPVRIEIRCERRNHTASVHYIAREQEPEAAGAMYAKFSSELEAQFGTSLEELGEFNRTRYFFCRNPAPVFIQEWVLADQDSEDDGEDGNGGDEPPPHELYVAVVPDAVVCLSDDTG